MTTLYFINIPYKIELEVFHTMQILSRLEKRHMISFNNNIANLGLSMYDNQGRNTISRSINNIIFTARHTRANQSELGEILLAKENSRKKLTRIPRDMGISIQIRSSRLFGKPSIP